MYLSSQSKTNNTSKHKRGFTLIELVIILTISALSAAVAIPICSSNVKQAMLSEADANLGSIRTQLRIYYGQNSEYPIAAQAASVVGADWNDINEGGLTGRYFNDSSYKYECKSGEEFTLVCRVETGLASDRKIDHMGILTGGL